MMKNDSRNTKGLTQTGGLTFENTEKYLQVNGINIHYHEAGEEHQDTIVFLHGGGIGASGWFNFYPNIEPFSEHFHTILFDMPNFGRSDAVVIEENSSVFDANILSEFLKLKGIAKATLMGNSKGGGDAIAFSVLHTDQLDLLVLMGAATGPSTMDVMPPAGTAQLGETMRNPSRENVEKFLHLFFADDRFVTEEYIDIRWNAVQDHIKRGFRDARMKSASVRRDFTTDLSNVPNPTLVVYGATDRFAAMDSSLSLLRRYPNSELWMPRNCGHWVQFEVADDFNEVVINWALRQKRKQANN
jgi:2-hydroxy-6-oxonona-2,4-dienedioate hydrolase